MPQTSSPPYSRRLHRSPNSLLDSGLVALILALGLSTGMPIAHAQDAGAFVYIQKVQVTQLSNAVRVTLEADGAIQVLSDDAFFTQFFSTDHGFHLKPVRRFHLRLSNCRSKVGSFSPVDQYPIDHLEFGVPVDAVNGVGLDVTVVLDTEAQPVTLLEDGFFGNSAGPGISIVERTDQRAISITVTSDLFPEQKPVHKTAAESVGQQHLDVTGHDGLVNLTTANEPLSHVARALAAATGLHVVVQEAADRLISAVLRDVRPEDALLTLADAYGLGITTQGDSFLVTSGESDDRTITDITTLPLRYLDAGRALSLLPTFALHYAHADPDHNSVVIGGVPGLRSRVVRDLHILDQPAPQCRVVAAFVTYTSSSDFQRAMQATRRIGDSVFTISTGAGAPPGLILYQRQPSSTPSTAGTGGASTGTTPDQSTGSPAPELPTLDLILQVLAQNANLHVDSRPYVVLANGQTGTLFDGQNQYVVFNSRSSRRAGLQHVDVGAGLTVQPRIGGEDSITLTVDLESSDVTARDPVSQLPIVESRKIQDTVRMRSGDTIYLGGLTELQHRPSYFKIPVLGDLPLLGSLFRGRRDHQERVQIAVFITTTLLPAQVLFRNTT